MDKFEILRSLALFKGFSDRDLSFLIEKSKIEEKVYSKGQYVFEQDQAPNYLFILYSGSINLVKDDLNGKRVLVNNFNESGTVFGEVYLYLGKNAYDYSTFADEDSMVFRIEKSFFEDQSGLYDPYIKKLNLNMLSILSEKAYLLNKKLLIHSSYSLRQKIANYLIQLAADKSEVKLPFKREKLAEYLGTTRPSLSRELMSMEADGLIKVDRSSVLLIDRDELKNLV